jgi:hypothetical protein
MLAPGCAAHHVSDMLYRPELAQDANRETSTVIHASRMVRMMVSSGESECRTSPALQVSSSDPVLCAVHVLFSEFSVRWTSCRVPSHNRGDRFGCYWGTCHGSGGTD